MSTIPSTNPRKRAHAIKVSLTPQLYADLVSVAEAIGQTPATSASFAIGQWVAQQKRAVDLGEKVADAAVSSMAPELAKQLSFLAGNKP